MNLHSIKNIGLTLIILLSFNACTSETPLSSEKDLKKTSSSEIESLVQEVKSMKKTVSLQGVTRIDGDEVIISLSGKNPDKTPLNSVRIWLNYNPTIFEVININTDKSSFDLPAPGENAYDQSLGLIKLGRSKTNEPITDETFSVAEIHLERLQPGLTLIDVFNYQEDVSGNTQILTLIDESPKNILLKPDTPFITIQ